MVVLFLHSCELNGIDFRVALMKVTNLYNFCTSKETKGFCME